MIGNMEIKIKFTQRRATYKVEEVTGVLNVSKEELAKFELDEKSDKDEILDAIETYYGLNDYILSPDFTELEVKTIKTYEDEDNPYDQEDFKVIE
jgi:transcriptional regulator with XRE-family HTH domain